MTQNQKSTVRRNLALASTKHGESVATLYIANHTWDQLITSMKSLAKQYKVKKTTLKKADANYKATYKLYCAAYAKLDKLSNAALTDKATYEAYRTAYAKLSTRIKGL